jgi:hypothetical protein
MKRIEPELSNKNKPLARILVATITALSIISLETSDATAQQRITIETFPEGGGVYGADRQEHLIPGTWHYCAISKIEWQSRGIDAAPECEVSNNGGNWSIRGGTRMGCAVTCFALTQN